jgi:hypothetical protein
MNNTKIITLIIPDLHHNWRQAEKIISSVDADRVIFLGDFFDDFDDTPEMVKDTCNWLAASVEKPNRIMLRGNHDVHYEFPFCTLKCSGYEDWKSYIISDCIPKSVWNKLKWYYFLDDKWLLSHAGLHSFNLPPKIGNLHTDRSRFIAAISNYLDQNIQDGIRLAANETTHWSLNAGRARYGSERVGGITWCDFKREFRPIVGLNQIVGHTPQTQAPKWSILDKSGKQSYAPYNLLTPTLSRLDDPNLSTNIDLDVYGNLHYAIWDGMTLKINNYMNL